MRVAVIVNPCAGGARPDRFNRAAVTTLIGRVAACAGASAQLHVTQQAGGGRGAAREALAGGAELVIAWGGDGTVNEVASVLVGTPVPLGIVPVGSGNGLARELHLPMRPRDALRVALEHRTRDIDVGVLGERVFLNVAGLGFDAQVARRFNAGGQKRGFSRYLWLTVHEVLRYHPRRYAVEWDGGAFEGTALVVACANSRQYGNGARVAPLAELDDGALDLVIIGPTSRVGDLLRARKLFTGSILEDRQVTFARVCRVAVHGEGGLCCHVDGEPLEAGSSVQIVVRPKALRVCAATPGAKHGW